MAKLYLPSVQQIPKITSPFMQGAAYFCRQSWKIEQLKDKTRTEEHRYYILSAITFAYSSIESNINEFFYDSVRFSTKNIANLQVEQLINAVGIIKVSDLTNHWNNLPTHKRWRTLDLYQESLTICGFRKYIESKYPYKKVDDLKETRNAFLHFFPEASNEQKKFQSLSDKLKKYNFSLSPFMSVGNPFFPDHCISHGCAEWAVKSAAEFTNSFNAKLGLKKKFDMRQKEYKTK